MHCSLSCRADVLTQALRLCLSLGLARSRSLSDCNGSLLPHRSDVSSARYHRETGASASWHSLAVLCFRCLCCRAAASDYKSKGAVEKVGELNVYITGQGK